MSPLAISLRFLQTQPDERLVALARDGHERAFEALVRRYRSQLLAYCRRVAPRSTAPEDILQQGLLQAWHALSSGAEVRDARAWLYRIVHNVAISALRASGELPDGVLAGTRAPGVDQVVEQRMAARDALAGLAALPDLQRQVMVSTALDGRSHEEIAAALGLSSGSVRGLIYRARTALRAAAAAVIPAPLIDWAAGEGGGASAGLARAGSAGLGALIVKGGGAILAVGAVAGTTAIVVSHHSHTHRLQASPVAAASRRATPADSTSSAAGGDAGQNALAFIGGTARTGAGASGRDRSHDGRASGGGGRDSFGGGGGSQRTGSRDGEGSRSGSGDGSSGGGDHSGGGPNPSGRSDGGGDHGGTIFTSGSDGGGDHGATTATTAPSGTSGDDGGGSSGPFDGGSTGSHDGGGSSGGGSSGGSSTTTTTSTTPTTTTTTTTNH